MHALLVGLQLSASHGRSHQPLAAPQRTAGGEGLQQAVRRKAPADQLLQGGRLQQELREQKGPCGHLVSLAVEEATVPQLGDAPGSSAEYLPMTPNRQLVEGKQRSASQGLQDAVVTEHVASLAQ